jgi:hypothetical protein
MNSTKVLGVNLECIPTSFWQRRPDRLCIDSVEKHSGAAVEDTYPRYMTEMTQQALVGVDIGPHYNKMPVEDHLEIESYSDKTKSCNQEILEIESYLDYNCNRSEDFPL